MVADAERFDPPLLAECQADEKTKLHQLRIGEVLVQLLPQRIIREGGLPHDGAGVGQRDLLALGEFVRVGEVQQLGVFRLRDASRSRPDRSLRPSILALDGLRDVHAAELLDGVVEHALTEGGHPGL